MRPLNFLRVKVPTASFCRILNNEIHFHLVTGIPLTHQRRNCVISALSRGQAGVRYRALVYTPTHTNQAVMTRLDICYLGRYCQTFSIREHPTYENLPYLTYILAARMAVHTVSVMA